MIGSKVKVIIDRPLGTYHPKHRDIFYTVNYGYVEGFIAPDGEEQDAYVLGIDKPLEEFTGVVLAVIHRLNDVEDKWIVVPEENSFTKEEIIKQVDFQEKYFKIEILSFFITYTIPFIYKHVCRFPVNQCHDAGGKSP